MIQNHLGLARRQGNPMFLIENGQISFHFRFYQEIKECIDDKERYVHSQCDHKLMTHAQKQKKMELLTP